MIDGIEFHRTLELTEKLMESPKLLEIITNLTTTVRERIFAEIWLDLILEDLQHKGFKGDQEKLLEELANHSCSMHSPLALKFREAYELSYKGDMDGKKTADKRDPHEGSTSSDLLEMR